MSQQISTLSFFKYPTFRTKVWAFTMMQFAHSFISKAKGLHFYKLMGSGKGRGFNPWPDWSTYSLLQVWDSEDDARKFFEKSDLFERYRANTSEIWTIYLRNLSSHGNWSGENPFEISGSLDGQNPFIAVITRAKIKTMKLPHFWSYVPTSEKGLDGNEGLIYTKGIGEAPLVQMATFSLWKDLNSLKAFAYQSKEHQVAIKKTKSLNWYSEELFSRFQPYKSVGTWNGENPLSSLC